MFSAKPKISEKVNCVTKNKALRFKMKSLYEMYLELKKKVNYGQKDSLNSLNCLYKI